MNPPTPSIMLDPALQAADASAREVRPFWCFSDSKVQLAYHRTSLALAAGLQENHQLSLVSLSMIFRTQAMLLVFSRRSRAMGAMVTAAHRTAMPIPS